MGAVHLGVGWLVLVLRGLHGKLEVGLSRVASGT